MMLLVVQGSSDHWNGGEHPARRKLVLRLKAETADCGGLV